MQIQAEPIEPRASTNSDLPLAIHVAQPILAAETEVDPASLHEAADRYRVLQTLRRGGMGEILLAEVHGLGGFQRRVVLKGLLHHTDPRDPQYIMFMREARLMALLDHPHIVPVFDLVLLNGLPYLAMAYVRGRSLHQIIQRAKTRRQPIPVPVVLAIMARALRGLHHAHALKDDYGRHLGIVHRDVTPGNLLVSFFGEVKVADFGIAKDVDAPRYTKPKSVRGKARYIAPEQVKGDAATALSDVYSAGVVLVEALLGEPLWERESVSETLLAIVSEARDVTIDRVAERRPEVPGLRAALRGALALNPQDRFASALQFAETLEAMSAAIAPPCTSVEVGQFVRHLFDGEPDVPKNDGFGPSGFPVPNFKLSGEDSESTLVQPPPAPVPIQPIEAASSPTDPGAFDEDTCRMNDLFAIHADSVHPDDAVVTAFDSEAFGPTMIPDPATLSPPSPPDRTASDWPDPLLMPPLPDIPQRQGVHIVASAFMMGTLLITMVIVMLVLAR